jgi:hypothetical protein
VHAFQHEGNVLEGFQGGVDLFGRLETFQGFHRQHQFLKVGVLNLLAPCLVDDQPPGGGT